MFKRVDNVRNLGKNVNEKLEGLLVEIRLYDVAVFG